MIPPVHQDQDKNRVNRIDEEILREWFRMSDDVLIASHYYGEPPASAKGIIVYCSCMADTREINQVILPEITRVFKQTAFASKDEINREASLQWLSLDTDEHRLDKTKICSFVYDGQLLFAVPSLQAFWIVDVFNLPIRKPEESNTEVSIRGPKDGFVEKVSINVSLIRTRLRHPDLCCEYYVLGSITLTKTALLYISDIANAEIIDSVRSKLASIEVEKVLSTGNLEELIISEPLRLFPRTDYTGRPDYAVDCLINGRFLILVDGNPTAIIAPTNIFLLLKSPEDAYFPFLATNIGRMLRLIGLFLTIFLPGLYIAITSFHSDQIPFSLLATISIGRHGLPMEAPLEMFFIMCLMELFREAGLRLPSAIGQTLTVVGGLIIGDAAIRAGMVSPLMIVVTAITVVAGAALVNQSLTNTAIQLRFVAFLMSATLGMYGFILSIILLVVYLASIESFGVPYLAPAAPLSISDLVRSLFKLPDQWMKKRPGYLHTRKPVKKGDKP